MKIVLQWILGLIGLAAYVEWVNLGRAGGISLVSAVFPFVARNTVSGAWILVGVLLVVWMMVRAYDLILARLGMNGSPFGAVSTDHPDVLATSTPSASRPELLRVRPGTNFGRMISEMRTMDVGALARSVRRGGMSRGGRNRLGHRYDGMIDD